MLRFCVASFLVGVAVGPACVLGLKLMPSLGFFQLATLAAFPPGILMFGDMPGITPAQAVGLLGVCSILNGLLYSGFGAMIYWSRQ